MHWRVTSLVLAVLACFATIARADVRNYVIERKDSVVSCRAVGNFPERDAGRLTLSVMDPGEKLGDWTVTYVRAAVQQPQTANLVGGARSATISIDQGDIWPGSKITLKGRVDGNDLTCINDEALVLTGQANADLDDAAAVWLASESGRSAKEDLSAQTPGHPGLLVHLPSGRLAGSNPSSLREDRTYQVVVIADMKRPRWSADLNVTACPQREGVRVYGTLPDVKELQAAGHDFKLLPVDRMLACGAGTMEYTLRVKQADTTGDAIQTSWRVRPVYHLAAILGLGFDSNKERTYSVKDQKVAVSEKTRGTTSKLGFTWFPGGVDFEEMRWYNYVVNPFLVFDLDTPKKALVVGNAFTLMPGLSFMVGGSFRQTSVPDGFRAGDAFTGETLPMKDDWTKDGRAWYVGIGLDSRLYTTLKGLMTKKD